ncbi:TIM barrel protein [Microbacterium halophytorum]|uniref:TIM barrel protein n=1 Tax=Microbacterium halophytorum TaxID=2067568 RepID=UPI000CFD506E|nr:TIM barrel protein [Microbacterium halophytorum]
MSPNPASAWVPAYGTNGFTEHTLSDALDVMQAAGYGAVGLTLGPAHFDPFAESWREDALALADDLSRRGFRIAIETGAPYLLDPFVPFSPSFASDDATPRTALVERAIEIAEIVGADCVSTWSGALPDGVSEEEGWRRLAERMRPLVEKAREAGVRIAIEPEPGMIVETVAQVLRWRELVGDPANLGVTIDIGHAIAVDEPGGAVGAIRAAGELLFNVHVDDMPQGRHEHLPLGEGDLDLAATFAAIDETGFSGIAAVELPRHTGEAPQRARESLAAMRRLGETDQEPWTAAARIEVAADPSVAADRFADAVRAVGRGEPARRARAALVRELAEHPGGPAAALELYRHGDADERLAVLQGLSDAADAGGVAWRGAGLEIVTDALRTNDPRLVGAAMGAFALRHLGDAAWRQGVLKLVFMEAPLAQVAGLAERRDAELAAMAERFAAERRAAGRAIPDDLALIGAAEGAK